MALIKCPECGKEISDKSKACIHCGYPLKEETSFTYVINGVEYNFEKLVATEWYQKLDFIKKIREITGCDLRPISPNVQLAALPI